MVNLLWMIMIVSGIIIAGITGRIDTVTQSIFDSAEKGVILTINLLSIMCFWLGIMKIIEKSGFIHVIIYFLKPVAHWLFPGVPRNHKAMNSVLMNMSANLLGMGNAATPFGIKAMQEMQQLNKKTDTATEDMCTFLAINTASLTLIPTTVIALRAATGAQNPTDIIGTTLVATSCSTIIAVLCDRLFRYYSHWKKKGGFKKHVNNVSKIKNKGRVV